MTYSGPPVGDDADAYRLWVSDDRTLLVRLWPDGSMEVAARSTEGDVWGPPQLLAEER